MSSYIPPPARQLVARIKAMRVDESKVVERERREAFVARPGPLQKDFTFDGLSKRETAAARLTQLIVPLRKAVDRGDRAAYDAIVPEFDAVAAVLETFLDADLDKALGADSRDDSDSLPYGAMIRSGFTDWE